MNFNFNGVEEASSDSYTRPGTIGVFTITEIKFDTSQNGKDFMEVKFNENPTTFFKHRFYMTEGAISRAQSLYKAVMGTRLEGENITSDAITAALMNKQVALKVTARTHEGKTYAELPFGGFAKPVANVGELAFNHAEQQAIDAGNALAAQAASAAPAENGAAPAATGQADDF